MDYIQTLEFQMAALQRKLRLLQDLRFFVETSGPEELLRFGDELRAVTTSTGLSVGSVIASLLGAAGPSGTPVFRSTAVAPSPNASVPAAPAEAATPIRPAAVLEPGPKADAAPEPGSGREREEALGLIEPSLKVIPAGSFIMGSDSGDDSEKPPHKVSLSAFRMSDHLVTNREFALFVRAAPQWSKDRADPELRDEHYLSDWTGDQYPEGRDDHPVAFVSFHAAQAFASWLGKRLPTEAEWERAARGDLVGKKYPGGDLMNDKLANLAKQYRGTTPARQFEPNGFGLYDMAGNLFEWTTDWYAPYAPGEARDPKGPPGGDYKVVRGGSWMSGAAALKVSARVDMESAACGAVGIRLVDSAGS